MGLFNKNGNSSSEKRSDETNNNENENINDETLEENVSANIILEDSSEDNQDVVIDIEEVLRNDIANKVASDVVEDDGIHSKEDYINDTIEKVIGYFTVESPTILNSYDRGIINKDEVRKYVKTYIKNATRHNKYGKLDDKEIDNICEGFEKFIWGYDILEPLIDDIDISDINITAYNAINIKVKGVRKLSDVSFRSKESYKSFVEHTAMKNRKNISDINAIRWFVDHKSSPDFRLRFNISTEVVTSVGSPYISIRKIPKFKYGFDKLVEEGMLSRAQVEYLTDRVANGHSGVICGKGGSGKTILLNEFLEVLPKDIRVDVIQDNEELFCDTHKDMMFHKTVEPQGEAKISYDLDILGRNGLLEDLDAFVIGEIKGKEAAHIGHMAYTGHQVWCTTHAEGIYDAHYKIADYARPLTGEEPERFMRKIKAIDTIIYMKKFKIVEIGECKGIDKNGDLIIEHVEV